MTGSRRRDLGLILDAAISAATNTGLVVVSARLMPLPQLTVFATFQLIVVSCIAVQRAAILQPALAVQRTTGRLQIPARWTLQLSLPSAVAVGMLIPSLMGAAADPLQYVVAVAALTVFLVLDVLRYRLYSLEAVWDSVAAGSAALALLAVALLVMATAGVSVNWFWMTAVWTTSGGTSLLLALRLAGRHGGKTSKPDAPDAVLRTVLTIGAWSGADQLLSSAANIGPLLVSNLVLRSDLSGLYRLFQSTQAPLNIATTAALTAFGLDAWALTSKEALHGLARRVRRVSVVLGSAALVYFLGAEALVVLVTGVQDRELSRVAVIVAVAGVLGALTIGVSAGSNALGRQRTGVWLRLLVVAISATLIALSALRVPIPWHDPVGLLALASTVINLAGWSITFSRAQRQEQQLLEGKAAPWTRGADGRPQPG